MNLVDFVKNIEDVDDDAIIFQEDKTNPDSAIILSYAEDGDGGTKEEGGKKYFYLIEVFLAKEFIEDWVASLISKPNSKEIAKRLYEYAINDA